MPIEHSTGGAAVNSAENKRDLVTALWRGARGRCPNCGKGATFRSYLKVNDTCPVCAEELFHQRADDAPPYFTMLIVGHIIIGAVLSVEIAYAPPMWLQMVVWPSVAVALCLLLLPPIKGILVALQWANRMHGFGKPAAVANQPFTGAGTVGRVGQSPAIDRA